MAGDQQAALFGQACFTRGMAKNTYGTGSFVLVNEGSRRPTPVDGLLTTVAWTLDGTVTYALEGSIFVTGAAIQWMRDGLGILETAAEAGPLAASVPDTDGVVFVPALTGLGAPWWDADARGTIVGITRGTTRAHLVARRGRGDGVADRRRGRCDRALRQRADHRAAHRRRRRARWTCSVSSRPTSSASPCGVRTCVSRRRSAPRSWPASPRASGHHPMTRRPRGTKTRTSCPHHPADLDDRRRAWRRAVELSRAW